MRYNWFNIIIKHLCLRVAEHFTYQQQHPSEDPSCSNPGSEATSTSAPLPPSEGGVAPSAALARQASLYRGR